MGNQVFSNHAIVKTKSSSVKSYNSRRWEMHGKEKRGVPKDLTKAIELYTLSANQGNSRAQCNLGVCYENGYGVPKDLTKAIELFTLSANQGDANSQCNLGSLQDLKSKICYLSNCGWVCKHTLQTNVHHVCKLPSCVSHILRPHISINQLSGER